MKTKFNIITSTCVPLPLENVDTDQIIPARFLKATTKEGFGENLFRDWRYDKEGNKNYVDFFVTPQNELLKNKYVKNLSREKFALNIFEEELKYQKGQRKELLASAKTLDDSVEEDTKTLEQLKRESEYLVGNELTEKQNDMEAIEKSMGSKEKDAAKARENAAYVQTIIEQVEKNIKAVKNGTYKFNSPVRSVKQDIGE